MKGKVSLGARELIELGRGACPPGQIRRNAYVREDGTHVKSSCVPDTGAPGKTPASQRWAPVLKPGALGGWHKEESPTVRRGKLVQLLKKEPCITVLRRINTIANLTTDKETETKLRADYKYVRENNACNLKAKGGK